MPGRHTGKWSSPVITACLTSRRAVLRSLSVSSYRLAERARLLMLFIAPGFHTWHHLQIRLQGFELPKRHGCSFAMRTASSYDPSHQGAVRMNHSMIVY